MTSTTFHAKILGQNNVRPVILVNVAAIVKAAVRLANDLARPFTSLFP